MCDGGLLSQGLDDLLHSRAVALQAHIAGGVIGGSKRLLISNMSRNVILVISFLHSPTQLQSVVYFRIHQNAHADVSVSRSFWPGSASGPPETQAATLAYVLAATQSSDEQYCRVLQDVKIRQNAVR